MSHENSETIERDGRWVNVKGGTTDVLEPLFPFETPTYPSVDDAVAAARRRSNSIGVLQEMHKRRDTLNESQLAALDEYARRGVPLSEEDGTHTHTDPGMSPVLHGVGVTATGFNEGLANTLGMPVDAMNFTLGKLGIPTSDTPAFGSEFLKKYLMPTPIEPTTPGERILHRMGEEVGASVPLAGAGLAAQQPLRAARGAAAARGGAEAAGKVTSELTTRMATAKKWEQIPLYIVDELAKVPAGQLARMEVALASGAGLGAGVMNDLFPNGGPLADFMGELVGGVAPPTLLGLIRTAKDKVLGMAAHAVGIESEQQTKARVSKQLGQVARPEQVEAGAAKAEDLSNKVALTDPATGEVTAQFRPTAGQATGEPGLIATERGFEERTPGLKQKFAVRQSENQQVTRQYFEAIAPDADPMSAARKLAEDRHAKDALLDLGLSRTEAKLATVRKEVETGTARVLENAERIMQEADARAQQRLDVIGPQLTARQQGELIRQEYTSALNSFRERAAQNFEDVEALPPARIPVNNLKKAVADVDARIDPRLKIKDPIPFEVRLALNNLGQDYTVMRRAEKGLSDLSEWDQWAKGLHPDKQAGKSGDVAATRIPWLTSLAEKYPKQVANPASLKTTLNRLKSGEAPRNDFEKDVVSALEKDAGFKDSKFYDPVIDVLEPGEVTETFKDLRGFRSQLKTAIRDARAGDRETEVQALNEVLDGLESDMHALDRNGRLAGIYPEHADKYHAAVDDYRKTVARLKQGEANKLRLKDRYGNYRVQPDNAAELFLRNETTAENFDAAFGSRSFARGALHDAAKLDFANVAIDPVTHRVNTKRAAAWMRDHEHVFAMFPDLRAKFLNASQSQAEYEAAAAEVKAVSRDPEKALRLTDPKLFDKLDATEQRLAKTQEVVKRTRKDYEKSIAASVLKESPDRAAAKVLSDPKPVEAYRAVAGKLRDDEEALNGFRRAIFDVMQDKVEARAIDLVSGDKKLSANHFRAFLDDNMPVLREAFGEEKAQQLMNVREALDMAARSQTPPGSKGSTTAMNLSVNSQVIPQAFTRIFAASSGRVSERLVVIERAAKFISTKLSGITQAQQDALLEEAFFNPEVMRTLVLAGQNASTPLIKRRIHTHLMNMNQLTEDDE